MPTLPLDLLWGPAPFLLPSPPLSLRQKDPVGTGHYTNNNMAEVCGSLRNLCVQNVLRCPHLIENGFEVLPLEVVQAILQTSIQNRCVASFKYVLKFWPVRVVVLRRKAQYFRFDYQEDPVARGYCQIEEDQFVAEAVSKHIYGRDETDAVEEIDLRGRNPGKCCCDRHLFHIPSSQLRTGLSFLPLRSLLHMS